MRPLFLLCLGAISAFSQPFTAGVKAGVPFTDFVSTAATGQVSYFANTNRYIIGVTGELRLPGGFGIEVDALYRHLNYSSSSATASSSTTGNAWEFPLLAKYRFPTRIVRPYFDGGIAWDTLQGLKQSVLSSVPLGGTSSTSSPKELQKETTTGFVLGFGIEIHALVVHLSPEVRYTRWGAKHFLDPNGLLSSNQNQAEFLLGITF